MTRPVEAAMRRHRLVTILALAFLVLLAWAWLLAGAGMGSSGIGPSDMAMPSASVPLIFSMWLIMMVAMMLPSAAPMILLYTRAEMHRASAEAAPPPTAVFLLGYLTVWALFSAIAAELQLSLGAAGLLSMDTMASTNRWLSGGVLILAGAYQLVPQKGACLAHCRSPAEFLTRHYRAGPRGALRLGLIHGAYCFGCCWALMLLLFVGGVMNPAWIAIIALLVGAEKLLPSGRQMAVWAGALMIIAGGVVLLT